MNKEQKWFLSFVGLLAAGLIAVLASGCKTAGIKADPQQDWSAIAQQRAMKIHAMERMEAQREDQANAWREQIGDLRRRLSECLEAGSNNK